MKRFTILLTAIAIATLSNAQTAQDALLLSQESYEGTARSIAMGNAFTALGGDLGAVSINPASSGVSRHSQISISPSLTSMNSSASYLNLLSKDSGSRLTFSNFGAMTCFDTRSYDGLLNFNFSIVYNRKASFNSTMCAAGRTDDSSMLSSLGAAVNGIHSADLETGRLGYDPYFDSSAPWRSILAWNTYALSTLKDIDKTQFPDSDDEYVAATENFDPDNKQVFVASDLDQDYYRSTKGGIQEYVFNIGMNFSDKVFLGVNLNMDDVRYEEDEQYSETALDSDLFQDGFVSMNTLYWRQTTGTGINLKFGALFTPVAGLRIGAAITTPTWYSLHDTWNYYMSTTFDNGKTYSANSKTGVYDYTITTPMRFNIGAAYTFGKIGLLSFDYERVNCSAAKVADEYGNTASFSGEIRYLRDHAYASNIFRIGGEIWFGKMAFRAGHTSSGAVADYADNIRTWSLGLGYKLGKNTSFDFAYQNTDCGKTSFRLYDDYSGIQAPVGTVSHGMNKFVCTLAFKF